MYKRKGGDLLKAKDESLAMKCLEVIIALTLLGVIVMVGVFIVTSYKGILY